MTRCPGGTGQSFCCGTDCCGDGNEIKLDPTLVSIGSSNTTATVTSTPQKADNGSSSKVAIGVGVGVPLGILAIAMLGLGFFWGKKKMRAEAQALREQSESQMRAIQRAEPRELPSKPYADAGRGFITPAELEGEEESKAT